LRALWGPLSLTLGRRKGTPERARGLERAPVGSVGPAASRQYGPVLSRLADGQIGPSAALRSALGPISTSARGGYSIHVIGDRHRAVPARFWLRYRRQGDGDRPSLMRKSPVK
jgi:hypothetical protein